MSEVGVTIVVRGLQEWLYEQEVRWKMVEVEEEGVGRDFRDDFVNR